jgi:hypothetical protein
LYPGSRLVDSAKTGIITDLDNSQCRVLILYYKHPKKAASEEFYEWLKTYQNESDAVLSYSSSITVYADGRVCSTTSSNKEGASAYFITRGDGRGEDHVLMEDSFKCGLAASFDAEISVASARIERAVKLIEAEFEHETAAAPTWHSSALYTRILVLCIDNQTVAHSILLGFYKIEHAPSVCASTAIKCFLDLYSRHYFVTMWVSLHTENMKFGGAAMPCFLSTRGNNRVDRLCTSIFNGGKHTPNSRSKAVCIAALREKHLTAW